MSLPPVCLRKDVILWELGATKMQGCDFKGVARFETTLMYDRNIDYLICQSLLYRYSKFWRDAMDLLLRRLRLGLCLRWVPGRRR